MDQNLIAEKLESLRGCVQRVQTKCPPTSEEFFVAVLRTRSITLCRRGSRVGACADPRRLTARKQV